MTPDETAARLTPAMREALLAGGRFELSLTMPDDLFFVWLFDRGQLTAEGEAVRAIVMAQASAPPRCGDHVLHRPSGEKWVVAWAEGEDIAWAGWPNGIARLADCEIIRRCTDAEHAGAVQQWRDLRDSDSRRGRVLRLYGTDAEPTGGANAA